MVQIFEFVVLKVCQGLFSRYVNSCVQQQRAVLFLVNVQCHCTENVQSDLGNCDQSTSNNTPVYSTDLYFFCVLRKLYKFKCLDKAIVLMCECKSCKIYNQNGIVSYFTLRSPVQVSDFLKKIICLNLLLYIIFPEL